MCFSDKVISSVLKFAFSSLLQFAIKNRFRHRSKDFPKREHWLDWAREKYEVSDPIAAVSHQGRPLGREHHSYNSSC